VEAWDKTSSHRFIIHTVPGQAGPATAGPVFCWGPWSRLGCCWRSGC